MLIKSVRARFAALKMESGFARGREALGERKRKAVIMMELVKKVLIALFIMAGMVAAAGARAADEGTVKGPVPWVSEIQGDEHSLMVKQSDTDWFEATTNTPIGEGDVVWQGKGGRSEIYFDRGTFIRLSDESGLEFDKLSDREVRVTLTKGEAAVGDAMGRPFFLDVPGQSVIMGPGSEADVTVGDQGDSRITVKRGEVKVSGPQGEVRVNAGQTLKTDAQGKIAGFTQGAESDNFDSWSDQRNQAYSSAAPPPIEESAVMPEPVVSELDANGIWIRDPSYGWVWQPRVVVGWAPYRVGRWMHRPAWGWTWVSYEPWGWYPYHYGRWVTVGGAWCWSPVHIRVGWSPALVFWVDGPDYVAWQPLPYDVTLAMVVNIGPTFVDRYACAGCITVVSYHDFRDCNYYRYARPWPGPCRGSCYAGREPRNFMAHNDVAVRYNRTPRPEGFVPRQRAPQERTVYAHYRNDQGRPSANSMAERVNYGNRPRPGATYNDANRFQNGRPEMNRPNGERLSGNPLNTSGERPMTNRPDNGRNDLSRPNISGERPSGNRPEQGTRPNNNQPNSGERPNGNPFNTSGERPSVSRPEQGTRPNVYQPNPGGERPNDNPPNTSGERLSVHPSEQANRPHVYQPNPGGARPNGNPMNTSGERPSVNRSEQGTRPNVYQPNPGGARPTYTPPSQNNSSRPSSSPSSSPGSGSFSRPSGGNNSSASRPSGGGGGGNSRPSSSGRGGGGGHSDRGRPR